MDVGVQVEGGMRMSYDPDTVYENLKISVEMMGLRMPTEMELYILQEEDKVACYSNMGGSWLRSEVDAALQNDGSVSAAIWNLPPEQLSIDLRRRQHPGYLHHPGGGAGTAGPGPPVSAPGSPAGDGRSAG